MNNLLQLAQAMKNPQAILQQAMQSGNPIMKNAVEMYQRGDTQGINNLAQNLAKERNIDINKLTNEIKSQFGL